MKGPERAGFGRFKGLHLRELWATGMLPETAGHFTSSRRDHRRIEEMNKGELVAAVADQVGLSRGQAGEAIDAAIEAITGALKKGDEVKIVGFGTFVVTNRAAGEARNPRTGEKVKVPASKTPKFRAGAGLKDAVNAK